MFFENASLPQFIKSIENFFIAVERLASKNRLTRIILNFWGLVIEVCVLISHMVFIDHENKSSSSRQSSNSSMKRELSHCQSSLALISCVDNGDNFILGDPQPTVSPAKEQSSHVRKKKKNNITFDTSDESCITTEGAVVSSASLFPVPMDTHEDSAVATVSPAMHSSQLNGSNRIVSETNKKSFLNLEPPNMDDCPGFFPGCGSDVPCDQCTEKNRGHVIHQVDTEIQQALSWASRQDAW
uniref:Uncharacterized protein n=1 Tax=Aureoumbra lagunensis TaxID=44058 RepID=A0A7S3K2V7_9STRA|mmetsp:Transcript_22764/g.29477  ORF Transcript_22764/g.29477 Transcript_22764/m.29477 type:complete len:241 (-) Transcript_22764:195-917(-)